MSLFNNYRDGLDKVLGRKENFLSKGLNGPNALLKESRNFSSVPSVIESDSKTILEFDSSQLEKYFGPNRYSFDTISIGNHPDFKNFLKENESIKHHCVSMFVDIKGSTRLQLKYSLEEVRTIKDTLLTLCINVVSHFGGHVHRLQGDAAFVQFVRKDKNPNDSIINALNAASVLCQAVSEDLSSAFESYGLDPIKIRVGIDYGSDDQVMWSHYGIANCNELTTTSIHTDLAAKLQHKASVNSIRIGKNLVDALEMKEDFFSTPFQIKDGKQQEDRYIIQSPELNYRQFDFKWKDYLKSFSFYQQKADGKLEIVENDFQLNASIYSSDEENNFSSYFENNSAIPKGNLIKYQLMYRGFKYHRKPQEKIVWEAYNSGSEAKVANEEFHSFENVFVNKTCCIAHAGYHGNHYLKCTIQRNKIPSITLKFPIYVDNKEEQRLDLPAQIRAELRSAIK